MRRFATDGAVAAADHLAASAGAAILQRGGNAVDAAIAAGAVMAVTTPNMCGLGGDLFAVVARRGESPVALNASGRSGSGADPARLRAEGHRAMPFRHDVRAVTVPGCVDGLVALQRRFATRDLSELLSSALGLAQAGFSVSPYLAAGSVALGAEQRAAMFGRPEALGVGERLQLPNLAGVLRAVAESGRAGFYEGDAGCELVRLGAGEFSEEDLRVEQAEWVAPLAADAFGHRLWSAPPNSQGYLALSGAWIADRVGVPDDPEDERWAFVLVESARQASSDRTDALHEHADGKALLSANRLAPRAAAVGERVSPGLGDSYRAGGTTCICTIDRDRTGVSLIMSNGAGFGSHLTLPRHGIFLHNRGLGFSLDAGHPAEYRPRRRPPHTLAPLVVTDPDLVLKGVLGTMGADAQPQILLQLLARTLACGQESGAAVRAPRWVLARENASAFHVWNHDGPPIVRLEHGRPSRWASGLRRRGYQVAESEPGEHSFGHAQIIRVTDAGLLSGAADPRSGRGAVVGSSVEPRPR
jgi:gamma-glutamyltranspeptidase / glutathione hydrolase